MQETVEFLQAREAECVAHKDTRWVRAGAAGQAAGRQPNGDCSFITQYFEGPSPWPPPTLADLPEPLPLWCPAKPSPLCPNPCTWPAATRSRAEDFILTLDEMYGKTIEDLKHEGQRDDQYNFIRY